jgi:hypothetical protein
MKTLSIILLLSCLVSNSLIAQEKPDYKPNFIAIKLQAGDLFSAYNPMLSVAAERRRRHWSFQMGIAAAPQRNYRYGDSTKPFTGRTFGYGANTEIRLYKPIRAKTYFSKFIGLKFGLNYYNTPFSNRYEDTLDHSMSNHIFYHTVSRTKTVFIYALVVGIQWHFGDHVVGEVGGGLGGKMKWITDEEAIEVQPPYRKFFGPHEFVYSSDEEGGALALPIIINIGYTF